MSTVDDERGVLLSPGAFFVSSGAPEAASYVVSDRKMNEFVEAVGMSWWEYDFQKDEYYHLEDKVAAYRVVPGAGEGREIHGISAAEWQRNVHPEDLVKVGRIWHAYLDSGRSFWFEYRERRPGEKWRWYIGSVNKVERDRSGRPLKALGVQIDITRIKTESLRRDRSEQQLRMIFNNAGIGIGVLYPDGVIKKVNPTWLRISGYFREEMLGRHIVDFVADDDKPAVREMLAGICGPGKKRAAQRIRFMNKKGSIDWEDFTVTAYKNPDDEYRLVVLMENINYRISLERRLQCATGRDSLTGLSNRAFFEERARELCELAERHRRDLAFCMMDIDNFKKIEEEFGREAGEEALKRVAGVLRKETRCADVVCRYGEDEFAAIFPETAIRVAERACQRIRSLVKELRVPCGETEFSLTATFGVAAFESGNTVAELGKKADLALYRGKGGGKDKIVLYHDMHRAP